MLPKRAKSAALIAHSLVAFTILWVWWPALVTEYGLADDYSFAFRWSQAEFDIWQSDVVEMGRPLAAVLQRGLFRAFDTVRDLAYIRWLSGAVLYVFGFLLLRGLKSANWPATLSLLTVLLVLMTPPFIVFLGWAVMCPATIGAIAALWGSQVYLTQYVWKPENARWWGLGIAATCLLLAACFYQPSVCFFLLLPLATILAKPNLAVDRWRGMLGSVGLFLGVLGGYFVVFSIAKKLLFTSNLPVERSTLVNNVGSKVGFILEGPVVDVLGGWWTLATGPTARYLWILGMLATAVALTRIVLRFPSIKAKACGASLILALVSLTFLPIAVVEADYTPFRTLGGAYAAWLILLVGGLVPPTPETRPARRRAGIVVLVACTIGFSWQARVGLRRGIVDPQHREWMTFQDLLDAEVTGETHSVVYRMPYALNRPAAIRSYQEFSYPSSISQWGLKGMFHLYMRAAHPGMADENLMIFPLYPWESLPDCGAPFIDGYEALTGDTGTPSPPANWYAERIRELAIPPFGVVTYHGRNWIFHPRFGPAWVYGLPPLDLSTSPPTATFPEKKGIKIYLIGEGCVFWTKAKVYPSIVDLKAKRWYYLAEGDRGRPALVPFTAESNEAKMD